MSGKSFLSLMRRLFALCVLCAVPAVWAHHSAVGFDTNKRFIFKGEIRKFAWVNPHAYLYTDVQKADGTKELWGFETGGPSILNRRGWNITDFPAGAKVTVYAYPAGSGQHNALLSKVVLADGRELTYIEPAITPPPPGPAGKKQPEYAEYK